jgi:hypothetical protein
MRTDDLRSPQRRRTSPLWAGAGFIMAITVVLLLMFGTRVNQSHYQQGAALMEP